MCNALSIYFKKVDIQEMVRLGIVNDLAVIMMLRVNEVSPVPYLIITGPKSAPAYLHSVASLRTNHATRD
jgi:hypothetical protein